MMNVGMVGVGCISGIYLKNLHEVFHGLRLVAVCDLIRKREPSRLTNDGAAPLLIKVASPV